MADDQTRPATPAVRKLANSLGVDLAAVTGTGAGDRIRLADVRAAYDQAHPQRAAAPAATTPVLPGPPDDGWFPGPVDLAGRPIEGDPWGPR